MKHLFDNSENNVYTTEYINLSVGAPGPDLLETCCQLFKDATDERLDYERANNSFLFQYGPACGQNDFREALATFLSANYHSPVSAKNLLLTAGASHGLHLILTLLLHPNALIIVDEVTYMIALKSISNFPAFRVVACPLEADGPDMKAFEEILVKNDIKSPSQSRFRCMYYTIPVNHNPTGISFSESKCNTLVELSRKYNFLIACDDVYNLLDYTADDKVPRLFALDHSGDAGYKGNIISNGSFSKILSPGVRVGWIECPKWAWDALEKSGIMTSGGAVNNYTSGIITTLLNSGKMQTQLEFYRGKYQSRMEMACKTLSAELHPAVKFHKPNGGYFIWLVFPEGFDATTFNQRLKEEYNVSGISGHKFSIENGSGNCIRLCAVFHSSGVIEEGIRQLCRATWQCFSGVKTPS